MTLRLGLVDEPDTRISVVHVGMPTEISSRPNQSSCSIQVLARLNVFRRRQQGAERVASSACNFEDVLVIVLVRCTCMTRSKARRP